MCWGLNRRTVLFPTASQIIHYTIFHSYIQLIYARHFCKLPFPSVIRTHEISASGLITETLDQRRQLPRQGNLFLKMNITNRKDKILIILSRERMYPIIKMCYLSRTSYRDRPCHISLSSDCKGSCTVPRYRHCSLPLLAYSRRSNNTSLVHFIFQCW